MTTRYASRQDAIDQVISPALTDRDLDYDCDAIFDRAFEWRIDYDEQGNELATTGGFEQVVTGETFWEIVRVFGVKPKSN